MNLGINGKYALITGGGRGLGKGIAKVLASEGAKVCIVSRTQKDIDATLDEMGGRHCGHLGISLDLTKKNGAKTLIAELGSNAFKYPDILIHNLGGTLGVTDPFCDLATWEKLYRFNFEIALELNLLFLPNMIENCWGRVINISSISSMENHGPVTYCALKAMLTAYTRSMGGVLAPQGIVMSAILPGAIFTEGGYWDDASSINPEHVEKFLTERQRIGRFGTLEEIGNWVAFMCSVHASFGTGAIVPVDGGQGRGYFGQ